jgi:hypothetical protein
MVNATSYLYKEQLLGILPRSEWLEKRWDALVEDGDKKYEYDFSGEQGWNCESVVNYVISGNPLSEQGKFYAWLKNLGLSKDGKLSASESKSSKSGSSKNN